ncbi:hypothetical protein MLD38_020583 [Melastoma candidum]|uniref:Uncharacterized protein n=1 Tax=Melastoma candidum TaxID=119954 RepID=A0ACB9QDN0_9MYRT|nr:hypothetical protein MLD38_020583 [Melastoma candidum]
MEHAKHRKSVRGKDYEFDLQIGILGSIKDSVGVSELGDRRRGTQLLLKACNGLTDEGLSIHGIMPNHEGILEIVNSDGLAEGRIGDTADESYFKDKKKRVNNKKPSKPPRPPKGPSLNASDHKLIQEISESASLKRARIERIRALKKARAASTSSSQSTNVVALIFTVLFFVVIIFNGELSPGRPFSRLFL